MEAESGWVIGEKNADQRLDPASLTKLMTTYLVFDALKNGRLNVNDTTIVSKKAWKAIGSRMFIEVDKTVNIGDLLKGLVVQSGNDAAIALAEHLGGSEANFAALMNRKATELGLAGTHFINASGLPDPEHYTTARDVAELSRALIRDFPDMYSLFAIREFSYNDISQPNRNRLLWRDDSFDGLKTGHTEAAGFCLAGTGERNGLRFIAVVMGADSSKSRVIAVENLLEFGFSQFRQQIVFQRGETVKTMPLYKGQDDDAALIAAENLTALVPAGSSEIQLKFNLEKTLHAPLKASEIIGHAEVYLGETLLDAAPLTVTRDYPTGSLWRRAVDSVKLLVQSFF